MKQYTFNKTDSGIIGKAFEMAIKDALNRKNANKVSPCGTSDFIFNRVHFDVKQNGSIIRYTESGKYIKGSSRVIYATHVSHNIESETDSTITISIDLSGTEMFCLDRNEFVAFLLENGYAKHNASRGTTNIQTCYNYKKDKYHGRVGRYIEEWAYENEINDDIDIIGEILDGLN